MELSGIPYQMVQFGRSGELIDGGEVEAAKTMLTERGVTDVLVLSHGWNNNIASAQARYERLLGHVRSLLDGELRGAFAGRSLAAIGVVWPSMRYTDPDQIPGRAASSDLRAALADEIDAARTFLADDDAHPLRPVLDELRDQLASIEDRVGLRHTLAEAVRTQLGASVAAQEEPDVDSRDLKDTKIETRLSANLEGVEVAEAGQAAGGFSAGPFQIVRNLLNLSTYYEMKDRAGTVGLSGVRPLLRALRQVRPGVRLHLVGHSFGGRLVSAAALGTDGDESLPIDSLHLLQAAFSQFAFGERTERAPEGHFRRVVRDGHVTGPILVTHTKNDRAVGVAYVIASALRGQNASGFGDQNDPFGAIGSNGAINAGAEFQVLSDTEPATFQPGRVYNLHADLIPNHGDVEQRAVVRAVMLGMLAEPARS